jgi:hypothetical protein
MPNIERLQLLVNALCSGQYKQTQGQLRSGDSFCCLGVACEVYRETAQEGSWGGNAFLTPDGVTATGRLPRLVQMWYELSQQGDIWFWLKEGEPVDYGSAISMNDKGYDFRAIAQKIVETFPGLTLPSEVPPHA